MAKWKGKVRTARTVAAAEGATARTPARTGARTRASCTRANEDTPPPSFSQAQQERIERLIGWPTVSQKAQEARHRVSSKSMLGQIRGSVASAGTGLSAPVEA